MTTGPVAASEPPPEASGSPESPESPGDYGYDLVHEVQEALRIPVPSRRPAPPAQGSGRPADQDGDLGYDDAHDGPGS